MTKSKSQLRAEAVERLTELDERGYWKLPVHVALCGRDVPNVDEERTIIADLLTDDAHESRGSYEERLHDVPVSDCPYCGCKRVVIHDFNDIYEEPHSYRVEHMDEKEAFNAGCFESYYSFDSAEKAVEHANMRDRLTDEPTNGIDGETNGIADGSPLVDRDPVEIMRRVANGGEVTGNAMRKEVGGADWADALLILADMVERDYVRREVYEDLRDEFTWETTFLHRMGKKCGTKDVPSLVAYVDKLEARVEELEAIDRRIAETDSRWEAAIRDLERMKAERDELQRQLDTMRDVTREFRDERDERKAKAESYAEALEKLGCSVLANGTVFAPSGNLDAQSRAEIEDMERSRAVSGDSGQDADVDSTEDAKGAQDTREKLEEDIYQSSSYMTMLYNGERPLYWQQVRHFLDRQAAITRAECDKPNWDYCETCEQLKTMQDEIAELKADNDYLRDRNEKLDYEVREWKGEAKNQRNNFEQATQARKHWQRKYENLKATSYSSEAPSDESEIARELGKALAEHMYREKLEAESNRTCTLAYDGKWLICSNCGESLQWFGVRTIYKDGTQERALGVDGVKYCPFCGARIEVDE